MILTCPNCTTRYLLPARALAPDGRNVKCSGCSEIWFELPDREEIEAERQPVDIPEAVKPIREGSSVPALADEAEEKPSKALASYGLAASIFVLAFGLLFAFHKPVVQAWPPSQFLFGLFGIEPALASEGLVFDKIAAASDGKAVTIEGNILNLTSEERPIPTMKASLRKGEEEVVDHWLIEPPQKTLAPGESVSFNASYESAAAGQDGATEVNVKFVLGGANSKTAAAGGGSSQAPDPGGQAHPNGGEEAEESVQHSSAAPHQESSHASPETAPDDHHSPHMDAPEDPASSHH
ncbi:MAG TPA: hypothetical protein DEA55_03325 [Rhodospirillaceae bacterium]|nr:hypothetical protein [Rhodospirillaceae bacterium]